jgi:hypothetical protein
MPDGLWPPPDELLSPALSDDVFLALADPYRRFGVYYLQSRGPTTLGELATVLVGWVTADEHGMATRADRAEVLQALRSVHLPKLADAGLVTFDPETDRVDIVGSLPSNVETLLAWSREYEHVSREHGSNTNHGSGD